MRMTVTLDADPDAIVRRLMRERGISFKQAINDAIRSGARPSRRRSFRTPTFDMGAPVIPLDKALTLAAELEDGELICKLATRSG
jgi:hypothetical protein